MNTLIKELILAYGLLQDTQKELKKDFNNTTISKDITFKFSNENFYTSFKKNFFTILMISLLRQSKIPQNRIISYSKIILLLRQIITSVDNILDNEKKGMLFIECFDNIIVENSYINLICQDLLTKEILRLQSETNNNIPGNIILEKIYSIAKGENRRNISLYNIYPDSDYIIENIHSQIGGELLEISLTAPCLLEKNNYFLSKFSEGLFTIGMSLQAIDDFFDMKEDYENGNVNLAISQYIGKYYISIDNINFDKIHEDFTEEYITKCITTAYKGFDILKEGGFPITKKEAKFVLKKLFEIRGLKEYVKYIKAE